MPKPSNIMHAPDLEPQRWQTLATRTAFENRWLVVAIDEVALPNGQRYEYTRLEPRGVGVGVVGFNAAGEVLLEREYRHGVGEVIWQLPGGLAAADEDLASAGLRELREETGYAPATVNVDTVRYLGVVWDNPGFGPMCSHIYAALDLIPVSAVRRDPAEFVTLHWQSQRWLQEAVREGTIQDRVVVAAVAYLLLNGLMRP
jgi:ADP-ribose pyrophosphatase